MSRLKLRDQQRVSRIRRVRSGIQGTDKKPRLAVKISNAAISAQLIDDVTGKTIASVRTVVNKTSKTEVAVKAGEAIAELAKKHKIEQAVLDRREKQFTGRIKALVEAANNKGLKV